MSIKRIDEIEDMIARGQMNAAQVFTQMKQLCQASCPEIPDSLEPDSRPAIQGEPVYVLLSCNSDSPEPTFIEIETEKGVSVSVPWHHHDGFDRVGPLYTHPASADTEFDTQKEWWRHEAEDLEALHQNLDDAGVPRYENGVELSAWGRVLRANQNSSSPAPLCEASAVSSDSEKDDRIDEVLTPEIEKIREHCNRVLKMEKGEAEATAQKEAAERQREADQKVKAEQEAAQAVVAEAAKTEKPVHVSEATAQPVVAESRKPTLHSAQPSGVAATTMSDYQQGYIDGLEAFAWWKDGAQYVGTTGMTLDRAIHNFLEKAAA